MPKATNKTMKKEAKTLENVTVTQLMRGRVVSAKTPMTAVVLIEGTKTHAMYKKTFVSSRRFLVHDEMGVREGDIVEIVKVRPMSRRKHWKIVKVVGRDLEAIINEELKEEAAEAIAEVMPVEEESAEVVAEETQPADDKKAEAKPKRGGKK